MKTVYPNWILFILALLSPIIFIAVGPRYVISSDFNIILSGLIVTLIFSILAILTRNKWILSFGFLLLILLYGCVFISRILQLQNPEYPRRADDYPKCTAQDIKKGLTMFCRKN